MKIQRFKIEQSDIHEAVKAGNCGQLAQLLEFNQTLEVQFPNIFQTKSNKNINHETTQDIMNEINVTNSSLIRLRTKRNIQIAPHSQHNFYKRVQFKNTYYSLIKMLFPEVSGLPPLTIDVMDTIFFNIDGSMTYIYTDPKRGLTKVKTKNYTELFLKRKLQLDNNQSAVCSQLETKDQQNSHSVKNLNEQVLKSIDYVALIRYRDESFIRLKEHEFKSIFVRPVQAYQKYKMTNNTHYIQLIPQEINYEEKTIQNIEFILDKHKDTEFFHKVLEKHTSQTSYIYNSESKNMKNEIKKKSIEAYLLYIIFQIFAYVNIHYHKQITHGIFEFMKVGDLYYLSNVRRIKLSECQNIKRQYARENLFEEFIELDRLNIQQERLKSGIVQTLDDMFDRENERIKDQVNSFIKGKFDGVENKPDVIESNHIFKSINQKSKFDLHELFANENQYNKFLKRKESQLDGLSPLTSISNISRKNSQKKMHHNFESNPIRGDRFTKLKAQPNAFHLKKEENQENKLELIRSKWYKQTLRGKREYFMEVKQ